MRLNANSSSFSARRMSWARAAAAAAILLCGPGPGLNSCGGGGGGAASPPPAPSAPQITENPQSQTVAAGAAATFTVAATGSPLTYQWSKNGASVAGATAATYSTPAASLTDDGASFTVVVSNSLGSKTSAPATLTVVPATANVTTYHNDAARSGQNLAEPVLNTGNVKQSSFGLLRLLPVDGKVDAQPLALGSYLIGGAAHNVAYVATEHDSVYAFDADTGAQLWRVSLLGAGETTSDARSCGQVAPEIGVTATPVIDRSAGSLFVVAMSKDAAGNYRQRLHALSLASGAELAHSPVVIAAAVPGTGAPATVGGQVIFDPGQYKERSALLLNQGTIYTSWASHCDIPNYTGWIIAYDESSLQQSAVFNDEPSGAQGANQGGAAFWSSNSGPAADAAGYIYAMTGNGIFDSNLTAAGFPAGNDYGNSILKLSPPAANTLSVLDYFTMFNTASESAGDVDLGSGGLMLLPDLTDGGGAARHLAIGAGKDRNIYLVDRDALGKFNSAGDNNAYQALLNAFPENSAAGCAGLFGSSGVYGAPVYFNGIVYFGSSGDVIRGYRIAGARLPAQASMSTAVPFCYPGATLSISANGSANAILWAVGNSASQGVLHAYDAATLAELYDSAQAGARDQFGPGSKYTPPTVANGKVFVGTQADISAGGQNYLAIFGIL